MTKRENNTFLHFIKKPIFYINWVNIIKQSTFFIVKIDKLQSIFTKEYRKAILIKRYRKRIFNNFYQIYFLKLKSKGKYTKGYSIRSSGIQILQKNNSLKI